MRVRAHWLALLVFSALPGLALADKKSAEISLPKALKAAVQKNPALQRATIDVRIAEAELLRSQGIENWVITAEGNYVRRRSPAVAGNVTGTNKLDRSTGSVGVSKLLPSGGTVSVTADTSRTETEFTLGGGGTVVQYQSGLSLALTQPLLAGRGSTATQGAQRQAEETRTAQSLTEEATARSAIRDVVQAYWELAYAIRERDIRRGAKRLAEKQLADTQKAVRLGRVAATEALAVEQIIATREEAILTSELAITQRTIALRNLVGMDILPGQTALAPSDRISTKERDFKLTEIMSRAQKSSPEILALEARERGATILVDVTENGLLPRLDATLTGGPVGIGGNAGIAARNLSKFDGYQVVGGLSLTYAVGRSEQKGVSRQARESRFRLRVDLQEVKRQIAGAVIQAHKTAENAQKRIQISEKVIGLAERNIEAETRRFGLGRATNFDVLQRQDELQQAQLRLLRAQVDYLNAVADIGALTGDILKQYGVKL